MMRLTGRNGKTAVILDGVILFLLFSGAVYLTYRVVEVVQYKWEWSVIPQYLFRFDQETGRWVPNLLVQGLFTTLRISVWTIILATLIGTAAGLCRISDSLFNRLLGSSYVQLIRNLPPLVLVFILYFFLGDQLMTTFGVEDFVRSQSERIRGIVSFLIAPPGSVSAFVSAIITLTLYEGAYIAEIVRAGIQSIEKGQWEASHSLGLSWWQQMRFVIVPQAIQRMLPPLAGQFISTIKDSAIVSVISIPELTFQGMELMAATYRTFEIWITITVMYFALTFCCSLSVRWLEKNLKVSES